MLGADPIVVDTGASPWTMLVIALVGGLVASIPSIFARLRARAALRARQDELALAELNRKESERVAAEERAKINAHLAEVTNQLRAVSSAQEAAMQARTANQASTDTQLAGIAATVGAPMANEDR